MEINKEKYSLLNAGQKLQIPYLIIQGTNDAAVKMEIRFAKETFF
jgi:hypothetical protein